MKKFFSILALLTVFVSTNAEIYRGSCGDNVTYTLDTETGLLAIEGTGDMWDFDNPNAVPWAEQRLDIKTVTIAEGVTSIGDVAFHLAGFLSSITIPNSISKIGAYALYCTPISSIEIPNSVTSIGDWAFGDCLGLTSVTIPNSVTTLGEYLFGGCI